MSGDPSGKAQPKALTARLGLAHEFPHTGGYWENGRIREDAGSMPTACSEKT